MLEAQIKKVAKWVKKVEDLWQKIVLWQKLLSLDKRVDDVENYTHRGIPLKFMVFLNNRMKM